MEKMKSLLLTILLMFMSLAGDAQRKTDSVRVGPGDTPGIVAKVSAKVLADSLHTSPTAHVKSSRTVVDSLQTTPTALLKPSGAVVDSLATPPKPVLKSYRT